MDSSDGRMLKDQSRGLEFYMEKISDFPKFLRNNPVEVTDDMIELYLEVSICKLYLKFKYEMIEVAFGICICNAGIQKHLETHCMHRSISNPEF